MSPRVMSSRAPRRQRGFSLVELMISVTIGMVVVLTLMAAFLGSGLGGRHTSSLGQMTEDASLALNIVRTQVAMAGYSVTTDVDADKKTIVKAYAGTGLFGCDNGFDDLAKPLTTVQCGDTAGPDSIVAAYQADKWNAIEYASGVTSIPVDCEGKFLPEVSAGVRVYEARFFVANGELRCKGNGVGSSANGVPMVANVQDLRITYGIATAAEPRQVTQYVGSDNLALGETVKDNWANVVSVRICVLVRSEAEVSDFVTRYADCDAAMQDAPDRRIYRAFTTTVVLQNRSAVN